MTAKRKIANAKTPAKTPAKPYEPIPHEAIFFEVGEFVDRYARARERERACPEWQQYARSRETRHSAKQHGHWRRTTRARADRAPVGLPPCEFETAGQAIVGNVETGEQSGAGRGWGGMSKPAMRVRDSGGPSPESIENSEFFKNRSRMRSPAELLASTSISASIAYPLPQSSREY